DPIIIPTRESIALTVQFQPTNASANEAILRIQNSSARPELRQLDVPVTTLSNPPALVALPSTLVFPRLREGDSAEGKVLIRNEGTSDLIIYALETDGSEDYRPFNWPTSSEFPITLKPLPDDTSTLSDVELADYQLELTVEYRAIGQDADRGDILVTSNDTSGGALPEDSSRGVQRIPIEANANAPCIFVASTAVNIGQVPIGDSKSTPVSIRNCGQQPLSISAIRLTKNSDDSEFALDLRGNDNDNDGLLDRSIEILPDQEEDFFVDYIPAGDGTDSGEIVIGSNDPRRPELTLTLRARGSDGECPVAQAGGYVLGQGTTPRKDISSIPLETIVLDASSSTDPDGFIPNERANYVWTVLEAPSDYPGVDGAIQPLASSPDDYTRQEIRLLLAGSYRFQLEVIDNQGFRSSGCGDAPPQIVNVLAVPNEKILVELTWTNPEDPDEADGDGSDVDLHMVKMGPGRWFEAPYDTYFQNKEPLWSPEQPSLDIDDTDGGGPENVQLDNPGNCEWYAVGVHYFRQFFGTAYVTIRIYIDSNLVFEEINVPLERTNQFWDVARIHWDSKRVLLVNELLDVTPRGVPPTVTMSGFDNMVDSKLCTSAGLYTVTQ
ncbi:MAG: choice-of-anchor D domain-containing protein, partial [Myxococcota bacterium]